MDIPNCPKCNSKPWIEQDHSAYYCHCICGNIYNITTKYNGLESVTRENFPMVFKEFEREKPRKATSKNTLSYFLAKSLAQHNQKTTGELLELAIESGQFQNLNSDKVATILTNLRYNDVVKRITYRVGKSGGSSWALGKGGKEYLYPMLTYLERSH